MYSHHITKDAYSFVPIVNMNREWTDETLYQKYGLTPEEIAFIEAMVRPMPADADNEEEKTDAETSDE